jgi:hypothetical protein
MKKIFILSSLLFLNTKIFSQIESAQIGGEFKQVMSNRGVNGIQTYRTGEVGGSQFLFPTWTSGSITTKSDKIFSNGYSFLYDKVRQELFIKQDGSPVILQAEKDQMNGFTLNSADKTYNFVLASFYNAADKTNFYEVLENNSNGYSLLKLNKAKFVKADQTDMERMKDGDIYDKFVDDFSYYISYKNGLPEKIIPKDKKMEKAFPAAKQKIAAYFNENSNKAVDDNFLKGIVQSMNN